MNGQRGEGICLADANTTRTLICCYTLTMGNNFTEVQYMPVTGFSLILHGYRVALYPVMWLSSLNSWILFYSEIWWLVLLIFCLIMVKACCFLLLCQVTESANLCQTQRSLCCTGILSASNKGCLVASDIPPLSTGIWKSGYLQLCGPLLLDNNHGCIFQLWTNKRVQLHQEGA